MTLISNTNGIFRKFREELGGAEGTASGHDLDADAIKVVGCDIASATFTNNNFVGQISAVDASANITTGDNHGLAVGDMIVIANCNDSTDINGTWRVLTQNGTTGLTIGHWDTSTAVSTATGDGSAGQLINLSYATPIIGDLTTNDITVSDSAPATLGLTTPSITLGIFDADDETLLNVTASANLDTLFLWNDTHTADRVIAFIESFTALTTNGNNVNITWGADGIFRL
jgi:hypothetical protein